VKDHVLRDASLGDGKAELQKLAMDPGRTPHCVVPRHPADQIADLPRHCRPTRLAPSRLPCPEKPKPFAVPTDDGLRPDDYQGVTPARPKARQDDPENPIRHPKWWPGSFPFQDSYLLAEGEDFCVERRAAGEDFNDLVHARKAIRSRRNIPRFLGPMR
jgi:hypothetical protein